MSTCHVRNSPLLQSFIYLMNDLSVRHDIIKYHLQRSGQSSSYQWMGTWVVEEQEGDLYFREADPHIMKKKTVSTNVSIHQFLKQRKKKFVSTSLLSIFTVCIIYHLNSVHYVSFCYHPSTQSLLSFDPGVELYPNGQEKIIPYIQRAFHDHGMITSHVRLGSCKTYRFQGKYLGVQFNGKVDHVLPADAFCQSWTLFFFIRLFYAENTDVREFLKYWCGIQPQNREYFLCSYFILPTLLYFPKIAKKFETMIPSEYRGKSIDTILQPLEQCFFQKPYTSQRFRSLSKSNQTV